MNLGQIAAVLGKTDQNIEDLKEEYKLFFETKDDEAECYLNIDKDRQWIELWEKDPEYRPLIIEALSGTVKLQ